MSRHLPELEPDENPWGMTMHAFTQNLLLQADRALWRQAQAFARIADGVDGERARLIAQDALRDEETRSTVEAIALARAGL